MRKALTHWHHHPKLAARRRAVCRAKPTPVSIQHEAARLMEEARQRAIGDGMKEPVYPFNCRDVAAVLRDHTGNAEVCFRLVDDRIFSQNGTLIAGM